MRQLISLSASGALAIILLGVAGAYYGGVTGGVAAVLIGTFLIFAAIAYHVGK